MSSQDFRILKNLHGEFLALAVAAVPFRFYYGHDRTPVLSRTFVFQIQISVSPHSPLSQGHVTAWAKSQTYKFLS
jgi:hypothetical protein